MGTATSIAPGHEVDLETERAALARARTAVDAKLDRIRGIAGGGADEASDEYIDAVVSATIDKLQHDLVVFGRIDDDAVWRVGLYGIDAAGEQLVIDWRAAFAEKFYQASFTEPLGLDRRVSYVGCIDDLMVEDFTTGGVSGSSPLMAELSRSRGASMRAAVATLQTEQDRLVRLDPDARLVLRGGPGTGKTVVGLHRAAWLVYNDGRVTADRILVLGPSDRFLRFVSAVLPTLGEARIHQTTLDRLLGPSERTGDEAAWLEVLDEFETDLYRPAEVKVGLRRVREDEVAELIGRLTTRAIPWRDRRKNLVSVLANRLDAPRSAVTEAIADIAPAWTAEQVLARLRREGLDPKHGALMDEVRARFEGVPARYSHVIVDEAQDLSLLQMRAVMRRSPGLTLVGDDAQRSRPDGLGLGRAATMLDVTPEVMATAYRMSAEIADWLNRYAASHGIEAVELDGIRPTGIAVTESPDAAAQERRLRATWPNVTRIDHRDVWSHKGVEYDAVLVDPTGMPPSEVYLAASRAAHELVVAVPRSD